MSDRNLHTVNIKVLLPTGCVRLLQMAALQRLRLQNGPSFMYPQFQLVTFAIRKLCIQNSNDVNVAAETMDESLVSVDQSSKVYAQ